MSEPLPPTILDRLLTSIRALIRAEMPTSTFEAVYEYTVTNSTPTTLDCQPTDPSLPLPTLNGIPIGSLSESGLGQPDNGALCLIEFANGDPTRPFVSGLNPMNKTVTIDASQLVNIGASASNPIMIGPGPYQDAARVGDSGQIFFPVGYVTGVAVLSATPFSLTLTMVPCYIVTPAPCVIVSGQEMVLQ